MKKNSSNFVYGKRRLLDIESFLQCCKKEGNFNMNASISSGRQVQEESCQDPLQMTNIQLLYATQKLPNCSFPSSFNLLQQLSYIPAQDMTLEQLSKNSFPTLMYKIGELTAFSAMVLGSTSFALNSLDQKSILNLSEKIALGYNSVSYHNFSHAFSLMLLNYQCLAKQQNLRLRYSDEEYFCILVAGLAHDLNHQGTNNLFEIKKQSRLVQQFGRVSVLEHMHIRTLWTIFETYPQTNFLLKTKNPTEAKNIITRLILSTDNSTHFINLQKLKQIRLKGDTQTIQSKWVIIIMQQLFHACDLGNPCGDYENYISWAALLSHQFNQQAILQKNLNLEVTSSFIYGGIHNLYQDQVSFVGNFILPLWKQIALNCPSLKYLQEAVDNNMKRVELEKEMLRQ